MRRRRKQKERAAGGRSTCLSDPTGRVRGGRGGGGGGGAGVWSGLRTLGLGNIQIGSNACRQAKCTWLGGTGGTSTHLVGMTGGTGGGSLD